MRDSTSKISKATLDDFVGYDYIKTDIKDIIDILSDTKKYKEFGVDIPKGLILSGAPGLGKTLLTRIISGETGLPTFNISASEEKSSANKVCKQISNVFKKAQKNAPSIVIMDELDRMIPSEDFTSDKSRSILSTLLTNLDGVCSDHSGVFVIATTNGWDDIDDALKRSGRLDRRISISRPPTESRAAILKYYLDKASRISYNEELIDQLAVKTLNFSCADLKKLVNDALLACMRSGSTEFRLKHFVDAIMKIKLNDLPRSLSEAEKSATAYHELGHCIVSYRLNDILPDIIIRKFDGASGANLFGADIEDNIPDETTRNNFKTTAKVLIAGMAAEELFTHDISVGSQDDLDKIRTIWCMCYGLGVYGLENSCIVMPLTMVQPYGSKNTQYPESFMEKYQKDYVEFMQSVYNEAKEILIENEALIHHLHKILVEKEFLPKEDLAVLISEWEENKK